ncbi:MAG: hypothetical protein Q8Q88_19415, partial [Phenylobacterium sp.]|uniref:hypothetical protein n=1 Tax=Phenylobacterium sp. TaxID=1871053 RepID=UPI00273661EE
MPLPRLAFDFSRRNLLRSALIGAALAVSLAMAVFAVQIASLDREIRSRFAGVRWTLPAQVYAAPQELYPGLNLSLTDLGKELRRLGYRPVEALEGPGSFVARADGVDVATRAFNFWDGAQPASRLLVRAG